MSDSSIRRGGRPQTGGGNIPAKEPAHKSEGPFVQRQEPEPQEKVLVAWAGGPFKAAPIIHRPTPAAAPPSRAPLATVDGQAVSAAEVERLVEVHLHSTMAATVIALARQLGLFPTPGEKPEALQARVFDVITKGGQQAELASLLADVRRRVEDDALFEVVATRVLSSELARRGHSVPGAVAHDGADLQKRLGELLARDLGAGASPQAVQEQLDGWTAEAVNQALRAPHQATLDASLQGVSAKDQGVLLDYLEGLYSKSSGLRAAQAIAEDLSKGGPAAVVAALSRTTRRLDFTAGDFDDLARTAPALARVVVAEGVEDPIERRLMPVGLDVAHGRLVTDATPAPPLVEQLRSGKVRLAWEGKFPTATLTLRASDGQLMPQDPAAVAVVAAISKEVERVASAVDTRTPQSLEELLAKAGLGAWVEGQGTAWLRESAAFQDALDRNAVREGLTNPPSSGFSQALEKLGLPAEQRREVLETERYTRALQALQPLPPAYAQIVEGKQTLTLPLRAGAPLDVVQASLVAGLQRYLAAVGALPPSANPGVIDPQLLALLQKFAPSEDSATLEFDSLVAAEMLVAFKPLVKSGDVLAADQLLEHPAVRAAMAEDPGLNPVDVGLAYLKANGEAPGSPPWSDPTRLAQALDRTLRLPVSSAALAEAVSSAKQHPLSNEGRAKILASRARLIADGSTRAFTALPPLTAIEALSAARRLSPVALPSMTTTFDRGEWASLADREPIAALKLGVAALQGLPAPVDAEGHLQGTLTGDELLRLGGVLFGAEFGAFVRREDRSDARADWGQWRRVIEAVAEGKVVISNLDPVEGQTPLHRDLEAVLGMLRRTTLAFKSVTTPTDDAQAASTLQRAPFRRLSEMPAPLEAARQVLAAAQGGKVTGDKLTVDDFLRLDAFAKQLEARTPAEKGTELDYEARRFLKAWKDAGPLVGEVSQAVARGALAIDEARVRSWQGDGLLEAKGVAALRLLKQGAELRQAEERKRNDGLVGGVARTGLEVFHHLGRLPGFSDITVFNNVSAWTLLPLKTEQAQATGSAPPEVPRHLRDAQRSLDAAGLRALLEQQPNEELAPLLARMEAGAVKPFSPRSGGAEEPDPEVQKLKAVASRYVAALVAKEAAGLQRVDASLLRYLLKTYPDSLGDSLANTAMTGAASELPKNEEARALIERLASQLEKGRGWESLHVSPVDDDDTRTGKILVQEALSRVFGKSELWSNLVPGRDAAAVEQLAHRMAGLEPSQLAPTLKGALILQGLLSSEEAGPVRSTQLTPRSLEAAATLAETMARSVATTAPGFADELATAAAVLREAAPKGAHTMGSSASTDRVDKALRKVAGAAVDLNTPPSALRQIDYHRQLPALESLSIRRPLGNVVRSDEVHTDLLEIASKAGARASSGEIRGARVSEWQKTVRFDPSRAVETAIATFVQFKYLMHPMVGYDLSVAPLSKTLQAGTSALQAETTEERDAALARIGATWSEWASLQAMMSAYITGVGFLQEPAHLVSAGKLDDALGKSLVFATLMGGTVQTARALAAKASDFRHRHEVLQVEGPLSRTSAVPVGETVAPPAPGLARTLAAKGYDYTVRSARNVLHPVDLLLKAPIRGVGQGLAAMGFTRTIAFDAAKPSFTASLSFADHVWVSAHPDGRINIPLQGARGVEWLSVPNRALMELGQLGDREMPRALADQLGLRGAKLEAHAKALQGMARGLPPPPPHTVIPTIKQLIDPANVRSTRTWQLEGVGTERHLQLKNATLVELLEAQRRGAVSFANALAKHGLSLFEPSVRAVLANYGNESTKTVQSAARVAKWLDTTSGGPAPTGAAAGPSSAPSAAPAVAVEPRAQPWVVMLTAVEEASSQARALIEGTAARYATRDARTAAGIAVVEQELKQWRARLAGGLLSAPDEAELRRWAASAQDRLANDLKESKLDSVAGRTLLNTLKAKVWAAELTQTWRARGLTGVGVEIVTTSGRTLGGVAKQPAFYAVLAMGGPKLVYDLGGIAGNPDLSVAQKGIDAALATSTFVAEGAVALGAWGLLERAFPWVGRLAPGLMRGAGVGVALQAPDLVYKGIQRAGGSLNAAEAVHAMAQLGVPEASFYKIDPERYAKPLFGFDPGNDRVLLEDDRGDVTSPRHLYLVGNRGGASKSGQPTHSSMIERLWQLSGRTGAVTPEADALVRRPQDLHLEDVKTYREPLFPTWSFLKDFSAAAQRSPELRAARGSQGFEFGAWQASVHRKSESAVTVLEAADGAVSLAADPKLLSELFTENDLYGPLSSKQLDSIERRRAASVEATQRWIAVLNALRIPADEKRVALRQFLENMAANHRCNSIMFEVLGNNPSLATKQGTHLLSAETDADDYFVGVSNFLAE